LDRSLVGTLKGERKWKGWRVSGGLLHVLKRTSRMTLCLISYYLFRNDFCFVLENDKANVVEIESELARSLIPTTSLIPYSQCGHSPSSPVKRIRKTLKRFSKIYGSPLLQDDSGWRRCGCVNGGLRCGRHCTWWQYGLHMRLFGMRAGSMLWLV
jgi:hypothetical protein